MLTINEIFYSIQGESTYAGRPCVFVRLTACDLRCSWCDTPYAFYEGRKQSLDEVLAEVERADCPLVEVTGGEPLLQEDVYPLMRSLVDRGKTVLLETGGHRSTARVPEPVVTILDVKCPGSGESARNDWNNLERLRPHDEVKFVVRDRAAYEFAREVIARFHLAAVDERLHERIHLLLQQRLAAGDLDEGTVRAVDLRKHLVQRLLAPLVEGVRRVTPRAAQVAGGQPDKDARPAGVGRLPLNRVEDFVDRQQSSYYRSPAT